MGVWVYTLGCHVCITWETVSRGNRSPSRAPTHGVTDASHVPYGVTPWLPVSLQEVHCGLRSSLALFISRLPAVLGPAPLDSGSPHAATLGVPTSRLRIATDSVGGAQRPLWDTTAARDAWGGCTGTPQAAPEHMHYDTAHRPGRVHSVPPAGPFMQDATPWSVHTGSSPPPLSLSLPRTETPHSTAPYTLTPALFSRFFVPLAGRARRCGRSSVPHLFSRLRAPRIYCGGLAAPRPSGTIVRVCGALHCSSPPPIISLLWCLHELPSAARRGISVFPRCVFVPPAALRVRGCMCVSAGVSAGARFTVALSRGGGIRGRGKLGSVHAQYYIYGGRVCCIVRIM